MLHLAVQYILSDVSEELTVSVIWAMIIRLSNYTTEHPNLVEVRTYKMNHNPLSQAVVPYRFLL
jgi:hypothetical protein